MVFSRLRALAVLMLVTLSMLGQNQTSTGTVGPRGYTGARGPAGIFSIGTVTVTDPGTAPTVTNVGTASNGVLNITIPRGTVFLNGAGVPSSAVGGVGDYYINTTSGCLYGPKTNPAGGAWPSTCAPFAGATGPQGPAGANGATGPAGPQGPAGPGSTGTNTEQISDGSSHFVSGIQHGSGANILDQLNPGASFFYRKDYNSGSIYDYPPQNPFTFTQYITRRWVNSDGFSGHIINQYATSGSKNYSNQIAGEGSTSFEKPNFNILTLNGLRQTSGQGGGDFGLAQVTTSPGDNMAITVQQNVAGCSDPDDECNKLFRAYLGHDARRFGMTLTSISQDSNGNASFYGSALAGYDEVAGEDMPLINLSGDLDASLTHSIIDIRPWPTDTRFAQLTPDTPLLSNSAISFTTSTVAGPSANDYGIVTLPDGSGGLTNVSQTVQNASVFVASSTIPVCIAGSGANYEQTYITAVNTSTNTITYKYLRNQHGTNELVSQGSCSWGHGFAVDEKAPGTILGGDHGGNIATLHLVYPVIAVVGGKYILYTNSASANGDAYPHTSAYVTTAPVTPGTLTVAVSGGQLQSLTVNGTANYMNNQTFNVAGQNVLAYPTITFSGGGGSCVKPSVTVKSYQIINYTQYFPVLSVPGDPGWSSGSSCDNTLTATMQSTYTNPYHLYPLTWTFKVIDPLGAIDPATNDHTAKGKYVMSHAIDATKWAVGNNVEIGTYWNQASASDITLQQIYGGQSGSWGNRINFNFMGDLAGPNSLFGVWNKTPTSKYWSINGPSAGVAYEVPPNGFYLGGNYNNAFSVTDAPYDSLLNVSCYSPPGTAPIDNTSKCANHVPQQYNVWKSFWAQNTNQFDFMHYDNSLHQLSFQIGDNTTGVGPTGLANQSTGGVWFNTPVTYMNNEFSGARISTQFIDGLAVGPERNQRSAVRFFYGDYATYSDINLCNPNYGAGGDVDGNKALGVGHCNNPTGNSVEFNHDGYWGAGWITANKLLQAGNVNTVLAAPMTPTTNPTYTGTAGANTYYFSFVAITPGGFWGRISQSSYAVGSVGTVSVGSPITVPCGTMATQYGYPTGTTIGVLWVNPGPANSYVYEGTCAAGGGGSVVVDGSHTTTVLLPTHAYSGYVGGAEHRVEVGGYINFLNSLQSTVGDVTVQRTAAKTLTYSSTLGGAADVTLVVSQINATSGFSQQGHALCDVSSGCKPPITGLTGSIGGSSLAAGACSSGTATISTGTAGHPVQVSTSDGSDIGGSFFYRGVTTNSTTVTVYVCAVVAGTPASKTYTIATY